MDSDSNYNNLPQGGYPHHQQLQPQLPPIINNPRALMSAAQRHQQPNNLVMHQQQYPQPPNNNNLAPIVNNPRALQPPHQHPSQPNNPPQQQYQQQYQQQHNVQQQFPNPIIQSGQQNVMHHQQCPQPPQLQQHQQMAAHPLCNYNIPSNVWNVSNPMQTAAGAGYTNKQVSLNVPPPSNVNIGSEMEMKGNIDNRISLRHSQGFSFARYAFEQQSLQSQSVLFNNSLRENDLNYVPQQIPPLYESLLQSSLQPNPSTILDVLDRQIVQGDAKRPRLQQDVTSSPPNASIVLQLQQLQQQITIAEQSMKDAISARDQGKQHMERRQQSHKRQLETLSELKNQQQQYIDTSEAEIFDSLSKEMDKVTEDQNRVYDEVSDDIISHMMGMTIDEDNDKQEDFTIKALCMSLSKMIERKRVHTSDSIVEAKSKEEKTLAAKDDAEEEYIRLISEAKKKQAHYRSVVKAKEEHGQVVERARLAAEAAIAVLEQQRRKVAQQRRQYILLLQQQRDLQEEQQMAQQQQLSFAELEHRSVISFDYSNDKTKDINGESKRTRLRGALNKSPATLQTSVLQFQEMLPDKQAKIMEINSILSWVVEIGITGKELARQLLEACGLETEATNAILHRRLPEANGTVQVESLIRASPNWNDNKLVTSVFSQHISHRMAIQLFGELYKVKINEKDPHIAMNQSRHAGIKSLALAHLIYDIIESIKNDIGINLKVMLTEALRIDERREAIFPLLDVLEALKVEGLFLDSMGVNARTWVEIQWEQRAKNREVGRVVSHKNAGKNVPLLSGDEDQRLVIFDETDVINAILVKRDASSELCQVVDKAEKDGATFYENNEPIIDHNNDLWLKSLEDRNNDVSAEEAVKTYIGGVKKNIGNLVDVSDLPRLIDYSRFSEGSNEDSTYQQSINMAAGFVLCEDPPTLRRMSIKDVHKSRAVSGHLGLATITTLMCTSEVERVTMMDPVRISGRTEDREHQLENLKELARQTNTTVLFSRCHDQDDEVVNDMEGWRQRKRAANNRERKEKEDTVLPTDEQELKQHGYFASIKTQRLSMEV